MNKRSSITILMLSTMVLSSVAMAQSASSKDEKPRGLTFMSKEAPSLRNAHASPAPGISAAVLVEIPKEVAVRGTPYGKGLKFTDKTGVNILFFSHEVAWSLSEKKRSKLDKTASERDMQTAMMRVEHWRQKPNKKSWVRVIKMKEQVAKCDADATLQPVVGTLWSVSDLDGDKVAEISFAYSAGCRSDVSPISHKVLMIEDGKKYGLRGSTIISGLGGEYKVGPNMKKAPKAFLKRAKEIWKATVNESL